MSEVVTIGGSYTATIYGTFAGATAYLQTQYGDAYTAWLALAADDQKRTLAAATRFLDRQAWNEDADTFAERDANEAFQTASYELAALVAEDSTIIAALDQGSNIQSVNAGGAGVSYFNPTSAVRGTAPTLPPILMQLVGGYLAISEVGGPDGGESQDSCARNPFADCSDFDRKDPY
jgi:hypothetical protein